LRRARLHRVFSAAKGWSQGKFGARGAARRRDPTNWTDEPRRPLNCTYFTPVTSLARSDMASSHVLQPESIPYGARSRMASMRRILPFSILNISASCHVHGVVGPAVTA